MIINDIDILYLNRKTTPLDDGSDEPILCPIPSVQNAPYPNIFYILHETSYRYSLPISYSKHLYRLQPIQDLAQNVLKYRFEVSVEGEVCNFTGVFGNNASFVEIRKPYTDLTIKSQSIVTATELPLRLDMLHQPRTMPVRWMPWDRIMMQVYLQPPELPESELFELADYAMEFVKRNKNDVFEVLCDINQTIYNDYTYMPGITTFNTTPYEVFINKQGVCQDFAQLMICLTRLLDLPARYRMGYIYTGGDYDNRLQSDASHAWVEVYLPYMGWLGFDPTNGCMAGQNHIRVACGRNYKDATPTSGAIFDAPIGTIETLNTSVQVINLNAY